MIVTSLFLVFGLLIVLICSPTSVQGSTQYRLWILAYNVDPHAGFVSACTFASTVDGACEYFDLNKLFVEKGGKKDFIAGFVTRELNSPPPADMQMCLEAQLLNGSNASPGNWSQCKPVMKDDKGLYTSQIDFTGLEHSKLQPYQPTSNMTVYEPTGNLTQPDLGSTETNSNMSNMMMEGNLTSGYNPVLTSGSASYNVQFFVSKAFSLGKPIFIKAEVDKEGQILINSKTVDTEKLIAQAGTDSLLIETLTIEDKDGQKPGQVWACLSAVDATSSPGCERPIQDSSNLYHVDYDYASLVQDMPSDLTTTPGNMTGNMTIGR